VAAVGAICLWLAPAGVPAARAAGLSGAQAGYLQIAERGIAQSGSSSAWGNRRAHWYNGLLHDHNRSPLASIWEIVPLFESVDYVALADPSSANVRQVQRFANYAERYWDRNVTPAPGVARRTPAYAPYPGSWNDAKTYFDDNSWWSLAFLDASSAMRAAGRSAAAARYLRDAERGFRFVYENGWDGQDGGGMWWNTWHTIPCCGGVGRSGEALGAATDLAARLYQLTGDALYLQAAETYIGWANHNLLKWDGSYALAIPHEVQMPHDGEGAMVAAFTALCESGASVPASDYGGLPANIIGFDPSFRLPPDPSSWCSWAESLAAHTALGVTLGSHILDGYLPLNDGPQWDAIYLRGLLSLYDHDHNPTWYAIAQSTARRILSNAREADGLFLRAWDGSSDVPGTPPGELWADGASVSVLAALADTSPPG
jgi:hypothetical protein